jgi:large subunit ribosomal protein L28
MARQCEITGSKTGVGMKVSHSNRHTKRTFMPNLQNKTYTSDVLGRTVALSLTARAMRTIDKYNGLDGFMAQVRNVRVAEGFSAHARSIREAIVAKLAKSA